MSEQIEVKEAETVEKPYTLRNVNSLDVFSLVRIIRKVGVQTIAKALNVPDNNNNKGWALLDVIIDRLPECQNEVFEFLAKLSGKEPKEIELLDADIFMAMIWDVIDQPKFRDFLKVAWGRLQ